MREALVDRDEPGDLVGPDDRLADEHAEVLDRRRKASRVVLALEVREAGRAICATLRHHLVKDVVLALEREDEHVEDRRVQHDRGRRGRPEVARRDRALEGDLVLCANCGLELQRVRAEFLGVGREDEAGERGLVDEGVRRGWR